MNLSLVLLSVLSSSLSPFLVPSSSDHVYVGVLTASRFLAPFLYSESQRLTFVLSRSRLSHFLDSPIKFQSDLPRLSIAIKPQIYDSDLKILVESTFFKRCIGTHTAGGAISVTTHGADLVVSKCDFLLCLHQVDEAGAIAVKQAIRVSIVQCCFVKCQAPHGIHTFLVTSQAKATVTVRQNFVGENGNSHVPTTFSLAGGFQTFQYSNVSFNLAKEASCFAVQKPEALDLSFASFVRNSPGNLVLRTGWAEKSEVLRFTNFVQNNASALFTGELFASAQRMNVIRNTFSRLAELSEHCILTVSDSCFDYEEKSSVLNNRGSHLSVRFENCEFGVGSLPEKANNFPWSEVCFVITEIRWPLTPQAPFEKVIEWVTAVGASPHVFGIFVALGTLGVIIGFVCYRSKVASTHGYGLPAGMMSLIQEKQKAKAADTIPQLTIP
jgi:hypothetical protein